MMTEEQRAEQLNTYIDNLQQQDAFSGVPITEDQELVEIAKFSKMLQTSLNPVEQRGTVPPAATEHSRMPLWKIFIPLFGFGLTAAVVLVLVDTKPTQFNKQQNGKVAVATLTDTDRQFVVDALDDIEQLEQEINDEITNYDTATIAVEEAVTNDFDELTTVLDDIEL